jgi:hypothetical protein
MSCGAHVGSVGSAPVCTPARRSLGSSRCAVAPRARPAPPPCTHVGRPRRVLQPLRPRAARCRAEHAAHALHLEARSSAAHAPRSGPGKPRHPDRRRPATATWNILCCCVWLPELFRFLHRPRLPLGGPCEAPLKRGIRGSSGRNNVTTESRLAARRRQPWLASSRASSRSTSTGRAPPPAARARHPHPKSPAPWAHRGRNRRPRPRAACAWRCLPRDAPAHPRRASRPYRQVSLHVRPAPEGPRRTVSSWAAAPEPAPARVRGRARATGS